MVKLHDNPVLYFLSMVGEDGQAHVQSQLRLFLRG